MEIFEYTPKMNEHQKFFIDNVLGNGKITALQGEDYAISGVRSMDSIVNKFKTISHLKHPAVSRYFDVMKEGNDFIFVAEAQGDSLEEVIDGKMSEESSFSEEMVVKIAYQLVTAVSFLETEGIVLKYLEPKRISLEGDRIKIRNYLPEVMFKPEELKFI